MINKNIVIKKWLTIIIFGLLMTNSSCEFRIVKHPGQQISCTERFSKESNAYIASYEPINSSKQNHLAYKINKVYVEYQYFHDGGFFSGFKIKDNCTQIIVTDSMENKNCSNDSCNYGFSGFRKDYGHMRHYYLVDSVYNSDTILLKAWKTNHYDNTIEYNELIYLKKR